MKPATLHLFRLVDADFGRSRLPRWNSNVQCSLRCHEQSGARARRGAYLADRHIVIGVLLLHDRNSALPANRLHLFALAIEEKVVSVITDWQAGDTLSSFSVVN